MILRHSAGRALACRIRTHRTPDEHRWGQNLKKRPCGAQKWPKNDEKSLFFGASNGACIGKKGYQIT